MTAARLLVTLCAVASVVCGQERPVQLSPDTQRILDAIASSRTTLKDADRTAARRMNDDGDREYRARNYRAAWTAYSNSYPNAPTAHAYIMAGDAHWRMTTDPTPTASPVTNPCLLRNPQFTRDVTRDLTQHYEVGFALAVQENDRVVLDSALYRRARVSAECLAELVNEYQSRPNAECVDIPRLRRCLGPPLLDGG